jgi:hypothetical protein
MKKITIFLIIPLFIICFLARFASAQSRQVITVDQHGNIEPAGYVAGLTDIARTEAQAVIATQFGELLSQSFIAASNIVADVTDALTGTYGFAYVTGHVVSYRGAIQVSTNVAAYITYVSMGAAGRNISTNGSPHDGHYVWHYYTATMNSTPWIKYKEVLGATNAWAFVELQSTQEFSDTTVNGVHYETIYRTTIWLPSIYSSAFLMAFCEILPGGASGSALNIINGYTINGQKLFSETVTNLNNQLEVYISGSLKEVKPNED